MYVSRNKKHIAKFDYWLLCRIWFWRDCNGMFFNEFPSQISYSNVFSIYTKLVCRQWRPDVKNISYCYDEVRLNSRAQQMYPIGALFGQFFRYKITIETKFIFVRAAFLYLLFFDTIFIRSISVKCLLFCWY